jgi:hypothetical protein
MGPSAQRRARGLPAGVTIKKCRIVARLFPAAFCLFVANAQMTNDGTVAARYSTVANKLIDAAIKDDAAPNRLEYLCYRVGNRLSGSAALDQAVKWSVDEMKGAGLDNVRTIPVKVPHWVRGNEPAERALNECRRSLIRTTHRSDALLGLPPHPAYTFDKIVPDDFRRCMAAMAVMSYVLADWPQ